MSPVIKKTSMFVFLALFTCASLNAQEFLSKASASLNHHYKTVRYRMFNPKISYMYEYSTDSEMNDLIKNNMHIFAKAEFWGKTKKMISKSEKAMGYKWEKVSLQSLKKQKITIEEETYINDHGIQNDGIRNGKGITIDGKKTLCHKYSILVSYEDNYFIETAKEIDTCRDNKSVFIGKYTAILENNERFGLRRFTFDQWNK
ncbi:hypothetical protein Dip510_000802 [Elusimicrobium posterum]|uniref:hypothetical protein n=1 Tax=Elusimicrobium posterum TaxID=3116653 RepID=UPI003C75119F